jgi:saccharopine dehydrogenase-like NADP-dependent oxidoreductase
MRKILILGAGRSASSLIHYLIAHAREQDWRITVADKEESSAARMVAGGTEVATGIGLDASDTQARGTAIGEHDLIISMLPAFMHMDVLQGLPALEEARDHTELCAGCTLGHGRGLQALGWWC